ncbi:MAG: energy transducer TonB [Candidatus Omnitrophota bacterium]
MPASFFNDFLPKADVVRAESSGIEVLLVDRAPENESDVPKQRRSAKKTDSRGVDREKPRVQKREEPALPKEKTREDKSDENDSEYAPVTPEEQGAITDEILTLLVNQPPAYPRIARMRGWEGNVILIADVDRSGEVRDVRIYSSSGYDALDNASMDAVKKWKFRNVKKLTRVKVPIRFVLTR